MRTPPSVNGSGVRGDSVNAAGVTGRGSAVGVLGLGQKGDGLGVRGVGPRGGVFGVGTSTLGVGVFGSGPLAGVSGGTPTGLSGFGVSTRTTGALRTARATAKIRHICPRFGLYETVSVIHSTKSAQ